MKTKIIVCLLFLVLFVYAGSALAFTENASNTFLGISAGYSNSGVENTFIGLSAGNSNTSGNSNTFLGTGAGYSNVSGTGNVFLGVGAGASETTSNNLYIANSNTTTPLI